MVSLQYLTYFMKIYEKRSMNKAAASLYVSQPALSQAMKNLEEELNVTLMKRSNRGVIITEDGERLYRHGILLMRQMNLIENLSSEEEETCLSISSFPHLVYPSVIGKLLKQKEFAGLQIDYEESRISQILENVSGGASEIGIIQYNNHQEKMLKDKLRKMNLVFTKLLQRPWAVVVGEHHPLSGEEYVTLSQMKEYRLIRLKDDFFSFITSELRINDVWMNDLKHSYISSTDMMNYLLRTTDMYMFCCMQEHLGHRQQNLHIMPVKDVDMKITIGWVAKRNRNISNAAQVFLRLFSEEF